MELKSKYRLVGEKISYNDNHCSNHVNITSNLLSEIESTFNSIGGIAPSLSDLYDSQEWRYCETIERKHKGKIGYLCSFLMAGNRPRVRIIVHNFAQGGQTATFDSWVYDKQQRDVERFRPHVVKQAPSKRHARQLRDQQERERKQRLFQARLTAWQNGSPCVGDHDYVRRKGITQYQHLHWVDARRIGFPLVNIEGTTTGIQLIDGQGVKRIYGKKKGSFAVLGDIKQAVRFYLCEGYATANAVFELVRAAQKRAVPYCVIAAMDAANLVTVTGLIKQAFKGKKITVCPDNDADKIALGKRNVGLLKGYEAAARYYTEIAIPPADAIGVDWCDLYLNNKQAAIHAFEQKRPVDPFDYATKQLAAFGRGENSIALKKACVATLQLGAKRFPAQLSEADLLQVLSDNVRHTQVTPERIKHWWRKIKRRQFAMALRAKSINKQQADTVSVITVASLHEAHQQAESLKTQHPKAVFITNAPMGLGKTKDFIQPAFMAADHQGQIPVIITPTKALTQGVSERFQATHYLEEGEQEVGPFHQRRIPNALAITINSIIAPRFNDVLTFCQTLFVDEYTQVLRAITAGTVEPHLKHATEAKLASLIQQSRFTYIADADFNQIALDQLYGIVGDRPIFVFKLQEAGKQLASADEQAITYHYYRDKDGNFPPKYALADIEKRALAGKRLYIASDSKTQLDTLYHALSAHDIDVLLIHADNAAFDQQQQFLDNPNTYLTDHQPHVVLVSPCVQSGISIEVDYFEQCFGLYTGTVSPVVFQQMLHRVRAQRDFYLTLPAKTVRHHHDTENATALLLSAYAQHIGQAGGFDQVEYDPTSKTHTLGHIRIREQAGQVILEGDTAYQRYETLCAQLQALDNQQANHAANFLCLQALARGVNLNPIDLDLKPSDKRHIKQQHQHHKLQQAQLKTQRILHATIIDDTQKPVSHQAGHATSEKDFYEMKRHDIACDLNKPTASLNEHDIAFHQHHGCAHVANYHALLQGKEKAKHNDVIDADKGVAKTNAKWRESKVSLLTLLFQQLNIDVHTGSGHYAQPEAKAVRDAIKDDEVLVRYLTFKLNLNVDSHLADAAFVNKILKKLLGLKTRRFLVREGESRYWVYALDQNKMKTLVTYHQLKFQHVLIEENLSSEKII